MSGCSDHGVWLGEFEGKDADGNPMADADAAAQAAVDFGVSSFTMHMQSPYDAVGCDVEDDDGYPTEYSLSMGATQWATFTFRDGADL